MSERTRERPASGTTDRTRRRFARRQWARRWTTWRWVVAVLVLVGLVAGGVWLLWFSTALSVRTVSVSGTGHLGADEIRSAAAVPTGEQLVRVDLESVERRVAALAPVKEVRVSRVWPDRLQVSVVEREAVAVVDIGGIVRGLDAEGVLFRTYPSKPRDLPLVVADASTRGEAISESARVVSAMPEPLAGRVDHVEVATLDRITLVLRDGRQVVWGSAAESREKARVLGVLMQQRAQRYDVSVPGKPVSSG